MGNLEKCSWKMVDEDKFILGISAERCGATASVRVLRPNRKNDLFLCGYHVNSFIQHWGLHNEIQILCDPEEQEQEIHPLKDDKVHWEVNP